MLNDLSCPHRRSAGSACQWPAQNFRHAHGSPSWWLLLACLLIACSAFGLRVYGLSTESFWSDEIFSANASTGTIGDVLRHNAHYLRPPLYFAGLAVWRDAVGSSDALIRGYSLLWSMVGLAAVFVLALRLFGIGAALLAAVLFAVNPLEVYFAQEARMYTQAAALCTLSLILMYVWCRATRPVLLVGWIAVSLAAVLTQYSTLLLILGQVIAVALFAPRPLRQRLYPVAAFVPVGLGLLVWVLFVRWERGPITTETHDWMTRAPISDYLRIFGRDYFWGYLDTGVRWGWPTLPMAAVLLAGLVFVPGQHRFRAGFPGGTLVLGLLATWMVSYAHPAFIELRTSSFYLPVFCTLGAGAVMYVPWKCARWIAAIPPAALMLLSTLSQANSREKTDWRAAVALMQREQPDYIAFFPPYYSQPATYYAPELPLLPPPIRVSDNPGEYTGRRLWIVSDGRAAAGVAGGPQQLLLSCGDNRTVYRHRALEIREVRIGSHFVPERYRDRFARWTEAADVHGFVTGFSNRRFFHPAEQDQERSWRWSQALAALQVHAPRCSTVSLAYRLPPPLIPDYRPDLRFYQLPCPSGAQVDKLDPADLRERLGQPVNPHSDYSSENPMAHFTMPADAECMLIAWQLNAVNPASAGVSGDERDLGLQVFWLGIHRGSDP